MMKYVLDTSFILNVLLKESQKATVLFKKISREVKSKKSEILILSLIKWEVANALRYKLTVVAEAQELYQIFTAMPFATIDTTPEQMKETISVASQSKSTVYDTSSHTLALMTKATLITCDKEYFQKSKHLGSISLV